MKEKILYVFILMVAIGIFKFFENKASVNNGNDDCEAKSIKPIEKIGYENINIQGHWFQFPKKDIGRRNAYDSNPECYVRVVIFFQEEEIIGIEVPDNTFLTAEIITRMNLNDSAVPPEYKVGEYAPEFDLTIFKQEPFASYASGNIKLGDKVAKEVVFYCYDDPREKRFPNCFTGFALNQDLRVSIKMSAIHLKHWRELYSYIYQYFIQE